MIPVNIPDVSGNEAAYLKECIDTSWISSEGPFVRQLEEGVAAKVQRSAGIAVANGSAALDIAVAALGLGKGDEVILPSHTIISCAAAIVRQGAVPVPVDCDPHSWNMDLNKVEEAITERTRAVMAVHIFGLPVDMIRLEKMARKHDFFIIEDAAQAHGMFIDSRPCGSFGDISTFSFYPNKLITTGEGGMIVTDNDKLAERCRSLRNLCFQQKRFVHEELGWNYRMSNLQAAVGVAQLERWDGLAVRRRQVGALYQQEFEGVKNIQLPEKNLPYAENAYWVFGVVLDEDFPVDAESVMKKMGEHKIGTRPFFWPMHEQPVLLNMGLCKDISCPEASRIARRGLYLPGGAGITDDQIMEAAATFRQVLTSF
ncbi:MAG: DegT/DnrJ/EryC1/StrS family aminotransferase [Desulfovibrio sp.]